MRVRLTALHPDAMDPVAVPYAIGIDGHRGATILSAFPDMTSQQSGTYTVLTGLLDRSALYGVLAVIEALPRSRRDPSARAAPGVFRKVSTVTRHGGLSGGRPRCSAAGLTCIGRGRA